MVNMIVAAIKHKTLAENLTLSRIEVPPARLDKTWCRLAVSVFVVTKRVNVVIDSRSNICQIVITHHDHSLFSSRAPVPDALWLFP